MLQIFLQILFYVEILVKCLLNILCNLRFVDSETPRVKDILKEMENFSPIGSSILNRSGVQNKEN